MRKNNKKQMVLDKIAKNLNFYDRIIMKVFKRYTLKIYKLGLNDAFNWENQKYNKNNSCGCTTAVQPLKSKE